MKGNALVTGVSSGFGQAIAKILLDSGYRVFGVSRTFPKNLSEHSGFEFRQIDLSESDRICSGLDELFGKSKPEAFDFIFLNAGMFGDSPNFAFESSTNNFNKVMSLNLLANKIILDYMLIDEIPVKNCIFSASIAGVRIRGGMLSYSVSKAALNALAKVYAIENPNIFFGVIGLCNMDTRISKNAIAGDNVEKFPELKALKERMKASGYLVSPMERARQVMDIVRNKPLAFTSGEFIEIRGLL